MGPPSGVKVDTQLFESDFRVLDVDFGTYRDPGTLERPPPIFGPVGGGGRFSEVDFRVFDRFWERYGLVMAR